MNLRVPKARTYATGVFLMTVLGFILYGSLVLLPIFLQTLLGYPALEAGVAHGAARAWLVHRHADRGGDPQPLDARKLLGLGIIGASFTLLQLSWLNLSAGYWDIFWPQFFQGISMSLLFVPLTTMTMDPIAQRGDGKCDQYFQSHAEHWRQHRHRFGNHADGAPSASTHGCSDLQRDPYNLRTRLALGALQSAMTAHGSDSVTATRKGVAALFGMVERQATVLSFLDVFQLLAVMFLLAAPLVLLMKKPPKSAAACPCIDLARQARRSARTPRNRVL